MTPDAALELLLLGIAGVWAAHAFGYTTASMPFEIMTPTQILLGNGRCAQFRGLTWLEFRTSLSVGLVFAAFLLVLTPLYAAVVTRFTCLSPTLTVMGFAPGGQAEISLLAFALHFDVAFIALHHVMRLALVMLAAQLVMARVR